MRGKDIEHKKGKRKEGKQMKRDYVSENVYEQIFVRKKEVTDRRANVVAKSQPSRQLPMPLQGAIS